MPKTFPYWGGSETLPVADEESDSSLTYLIGRSALQRCVVSTDCVRKKTIQWDFHPQENIEV